MRIIRGGEVLKRPDGFSLIEVIIAIMILAIGILALIGAYSTYVKTDTYAKIKTIELNIARSKMEEAMAYPQATSGEVVSNNFRFAYSVAVIHRVINEEIDVYEIKVSVHKAGDTKEKGVELIAYREK